MIKSFGNALTEALFNGDKLSKKQAKLFPSLLIKKACLQLDLTNQAERLEDFYFPPSNHFEALVGDLKGFYSIRINRGPWRVIFKWDEGHAEEVAIVDYH
jgi:proteic killer suppression protein